MRDSQYLCIRSLQDQLLPVDLFPATRQLRVQLAVGKPFCVNFTWYRASSTVEGYLYVPIGGYHVSQMPHSYCVIEVVGGLFTDQRGELGLEVSLGLFNLHQD